MKSPREPAHGEQQPSGPLPHDVDDSSLREDTGVRPSAPSTGHHSTASTASGSTVKAAAAPHSAAAGLEASAYPFPVVGAISGGSLSGTPLATPGSHMPFTALSPTIPPKNEDAGPGEAATRGYSRPSFVRRATPTRPQHSMREGRPGLPGAFDIAVRIQSEPSVSGWWEQVVQVLSETFGAERATLAVPSDSTDIENTPWFLFATYNFEDEELLSQPTTGTLSTRSSLNEMLDREPAAAQKPQHKGSATNLHSAASATSRPKLESRHSVAGYPFAQTPSEEGPSESTPIESNRPSPSRHRSAFFDDKPHTSHPYQRSPDQLGTHASVPNYKGPMSEDTYISSRMPAGRVLQGSHPLQSETEPLITSSGVTKLLDYSNAIVLTRKYFDVPSPMDGAAAVQITKKKRYSGDSLMRPKMSKSGYSGQKLDSKTSASSIRHHSSSSSRPKGVGRSMLRRASSNNRKSGDAIVVYEDVEQQPGIPWTQSPGPSPSDLSDPEENPLLIHLAGDGTDAAAIDYFSSRQIELTSHGRNASIIQIPLIHPNGSISQPASTIRSREVKRLRDPRTSTPDVAPGVQSRQPSNEKENKKTPVAILSVFSSVCPYLPELVALLNELAPMLATSLHNARLHFSLQREVDALVRQRDRSGTGHLMSGGKSAGRLSPSTPYSFIEIDREARQGLSPPSAGSVASDSSNATIQSSHGSTGGFGENPARIAKDGALNPEAEATKHYVQSPGIRDSDSYFSSEGSPTAPSDLGHPKSGHRRPSPALNRSSSQRKRPLRSPSSSQQGSSTTSSRDMQLPENESQHSTKGGSTANILREPSMSVLRSMIENGATQQFIAEADNGKLVWANSKFFSYRSSNDETIDEQLWSNVYPSDRKKFRKEFSRCLDSGEQLSHQARIKRFDGQYRWFHIKFLPLKDKQHVTKYWHGQAMDIHDLHEAEVKAAKSKEKATSEARYRAIANSLPVIVFAASIHRGMVFANNQWLTYSGQTLEGALAFGFLDHIHPDDLIKCRIPDDFKGDSTPVLHSPHVDGEKHPLSRTYSTESSNAESEGTTQTDSTAKPLRDGQGTSAIELDLPSELLKKLAEDKVVTCIRDGLGNLSVTTELRLKSREGEYRWHLVQGTYLESVDFGQGEAPWFIACTDISNQKNTEAKIQKANIALENVNVALEKEMQRKMEYLSSMSHEIRTPLNGIIGNLQFLLNSGLEESASEWAHGAQDAAKNMHDLINDILDLSKAEANMLKLSFHWFNPRSVLEQVMDVLEAKATEKKLEVCSETDDEVPESIRGDSGRIRQVLLNLVGNAIKFTTSGEIWVRCDVMHELPQNFITEPASANEIFVRWVITDTGLGFREADKKLLFKPYSQIQTKKTRDTGGTGLGLILCKTMVNLHGGDISATSQLGKGSVFTFFARFKSRRNSPMSHASLSQASLPGSSTTSIPSPLSVPRTETVGGSPGSILGPNAMPSYYSPSLLSDSSSAKSAHSHQPSLRSSSSTISSQKHIPPMQLTMPSPGEEHKLPERSRDLTSPTSPLRHTAQKPSLSSISQSGSVSPRSPPATGVPQEPSGVIPNRSVPSSHTHRKSSVSDRGEIAKSLVQDQEMALSRPPMLSVLVVCPLEHTRRVTHEKIRSIAPKSAPVNITSEGSVSAAFELLQGSDAVRFTHLVLRLTSDHDVQEIVGRVLDSPKHAQTCTVILTDQEQVNTLKQRFPELNFDELGKQDRVKLVLKPIHAYKLAKIFDPLNENKLGYGDRKEVKRKEEKRQQKEAYELFARKLGSRGIRVMAVEDDKVQMKVLHNFLSEICRLDTTKAWNGQECLNLYQKYGPGYYSAIISDVEMPVMDGLTMCRKIRALEEERCWPPVSVVSLSANTLSEGWAHSSNAGFSHYCGKPVQFRDLGNILLEITDPAKGHTFLRDRQMPLDLLKKLGLIDDDDDDDEDDEDEEEDERGEGPGA